MPFFPFWAMPIEGGIIPPGTFLYRRPGGVFLYHRSGGGPNYYYRP